MKAQSLAKMQQLQQDARKRILARGKVEFRTEPELKTALLDLAAKRRVPVGPMIRQWVKERLQQEANLPPSQLDNIEHKLDFAVQLLTKRRKAE